MTFFDPRPEAAVLDAEYWRLLGFPPDYEPDERVVNLARWAREWFTTHGRPWVCAQGIDSFKLSDGAVECDGIAFRSPSLREKLTSAGASGATVVAVCAGVEAEREAQRLWQEERPDEYFFLETFAGAVVEHLVTTTGAQLCADAEHQGRVVLPHYSPGYPGWDLSEQAPLVQLLRRGDWPAKARLEVLPSGQLVPKKSLVALFGLAPKSDRLMALTGLVPCQNCSYSPCAFRRAPYRHGPGCNPVEVADGKLNVTSSPARYETNVKALARWARERLRIEIAPDGTLEARFRFDGSTCSNAGMPLAFDYTVQLSGRADGHRLLSASASPAMDDIGARAMCGFLRDPTGHPALISAPPPVLGWPLDRALEWRPDVLQSGCLCNDADRNHKWRLVLQTLHYRLVHEVERPM